MIKISLGVLFRHGVLAAFVCLFAFASTQAEAATKKKHKQTSAQSHTKSTRSKARTSTTTCTSVRVKTAKGYRTQKKCTVQDSNKPLTGGAVDTQNGKELKARTIPDRAYAVDGYTFFHQGRKYRVLGIDETRIPAGSDLAKQRLQLALDSGTITVEPETVEDNGTTRAVVKISGKNLAEVLNASN